MADLGDLLGSLMSGVIRARRVADEETAALAEYYKSNPLLEGLSVPRIRIPELTIDMPFLIEDQVAGKSGEIGKLSDIASAAQSQLKATLKKNNIEIDSAFHDAFANSVKSELEFMSKSGAPALKETVARALDNALANSLSKTGASLPASARTTIAGDLRASVTAASIAKDSVSPSIVANIRTADVKERATSTSVVRLKITLKEEGLEWTTQASESGGVVQSLQPE